jgi:carbon storage regulator CsrA
VGVDGQFVRLGIEAPASSKILREELWHQVAKDNQEAASARAFAQALAQVHGDDATG